MVKDHHEKVSTYWKSDTLERQRSWRIPTPSSLSSRVHSQNMGLQWKKQTHVKPIYRCDGVKECNELLRQNEECNTIGPSFSETEGKNILLSDIPNTE